MRKMILLGLFLISGCTTEEESWCGYSKAKIMLGNAARDFTVKSCVNDLGIPHGRTEMYRKPEGTLLGRGTQQNGFLEGKTEEFAEDGTTVIRIEMYHKGKMISYRDL